MQRQRSGREYIKTHWVSGTRKKQPVQIVRWPDHLY